MTSGLTMKNPSHPGAFIRDAIIDGNELSVKEAADALGVARPTLSNFLNAKADLSPEMALRLEKAFGLSMETLMRMQANYDIAQARLMADRIDVQPYRRRDPEPALL